MELVGGIKKILSKGRQAPNAVRFHVPKDGGWAQVTWGEVAEKATALALALREMGAGPGTKVAVFATTRVEWGYVVPAIEALRAVFVPVYFSNTAKQTAYVVKHSDAEIVFTESALLPRVLERLEDYSAVRRIIVWDMDSSAEALIANSGESAASQARFVGLEAMIEQGRVFHRAAPDAIDDLVSQICGTDVAAIIYTSGTTGVPKGAVLSVDNLRATTQSWYEVLSPAFPEPGDRRDILWLPVSHMAGWGILGQGTLFDYETYLSDPGSLLGILPEARPTMLMSVPAYWEKMYGIAKNSSTDVSAQHKKLHEITGGALRFLISGGAGLKREVKTFFADAGIHMIEGYGMTECSPNITMNRLDDFDFGSVGKPVPGVEVRLADDGEILVKGDNVFLGYYKMPTETAACLDPDGWLHTGDLGVFNEAGFLSIQGRKKEIIVTSGGKKIGPAGIEQQFVGSRLFEHVVLYGDEHKYLVALMTLNAAGVAAWAAERGLAADDLAALARSAALIAAAQEAVDQVNAELSSYETIKRFHLHPGALTVASGQLTPSLKLRRKQVWADFQAELEALYRS